MNNEPQATPGPKLPTPVPEADLPQAATPSPAPAEIAAPPALTPEEQMALYEKELKETDWGHQPC